MTTLIIVAAFFGAVVFWYLGVFVAFIVFALDECKQHKHKELVYFGEQIGGGPFFGPELSWISLAIFFHNKFMRWFDGRCIKNPYYKK